jgi:hypothetical protein
MLRAFHSQTDAIPQGVRNERDIFLTNIQCTAILPFLCSEIRSGLRMGLRDAGGILTPSALPQDCYDCPRDMHALQLYLDGRSRRFALAVAAGFRLINGGNTTIG